MVGRERFPAIVSAALTGLDDSCEPSPRAILRADMGRTFGAEEQENLAMKSVSFATAKASKRPARWTALALSVVSLPAAV